MMLRDGGEPIPPIGDPDGGRGLEIFTGMEAGERGEDGSYPERSFNRVVERLEVFGDVVKEEKKNGEADLDNQSET